VGTERRVPGRWAAAVDVAGDRVRALARRILVRRPGPEVAVGASDSSSSRDASDPGAAAASDAPLASTVDEYFTNALEWLSEAYRSTPFWTERDIVYTLQGELARELHRDGAPWHVLNGHRVNPGERPAVSADLVLVARSGAVALGAEFKYEPCHRSPTLPRASSPLRCGQMSSMTRYEPAKWSIGEQQRWCTPS
jgi:hypothetical protein